MIQSALFFLLGVLCVAFVVGLVTPSIWRRASILTRRRVETELPLTLTEIQGEKDGLRAVYAVQARKLEMQIKALVEQKALQSIKLGKQHHELKRLAELETELSALRQNLNDAAETQLQTTTLVTSEHAENERLQRENERLQRHHDAIGSLSDTLRIELTALETEKSVLMNQLHDMRQVRKEDKMRESRLNTQLTAAQAAFEGEKRRNVELEERLARLMTALSDAQEKLGRSKAANPGAKLSAEDGRIREQISALAADMVAITAETEGPTSPIHAALDVLPLGVLPGNTDLSQSGPDSRSVPGKPKSKGKNVSLADRIKHLPKSS